MKFRSVFGNKNLENNPDDEKDENHYNDNYINEKINESTNEENFDPNKFKFPKKENNSMIDLLENKISKKSLYNTNSVHLIINILDDVE